MESQYPHQEYKDNKLQLFSLGACEDLIKYVGKKDTLIS